MSTRNVDTAIRYAISVSEKGLQQAVALTKDLERPVEGHPGRRGRFDEGCPDPVQRSGEGRGVR